MLLLLLKAAADISPHACVSADSHSQLCTAPGGPLQGLLERATAAESLCAIAAELKAARTAMLSHVPHSEHPVVEAFFSRTVEASGTPFMCIALVCSVLLCSSALDLIPGR